MRKKAVVETACRSLDSAPDCSSTPPLPRGYSAMGKGNNAQKNDKKNKKPKQEKAKPAGKQ
jgi:hypothetical protein